MRKGSFLILLGVITIGGYSRQASAQPVFARIFPAEEFAARRAAVMKEIGNGVASCRFRIYSPPQPGRRKAPIRLE